MFQNISVKEGKCYSYSVTTKVGKKSAVEEIWSDYFS